MGVLSNVVRVILGAILLLVGFGLRKAYISTGIQLRLSGDKYFTPGYKFRRFLLFLFGYSAIIFSVYIFYTVIF